MQTKLGYSIYMAHLKRKEMSFFIEPTTYGAAFYYGDVSCMGEITPQPAQSISQKLTSD